VDVGEIDNVADWERHAEDWRRVAEASPRATVFQTWEWLRTWWEHFGAGKRLWVLAFRDPDGTAAGFAPLYLPPRPSPLRTARFLGTGVSDYGDILALPGREADVCAALWEFLAGRRAAWDWLDLQQVRPGAALDGDEGGDGGGRAPQCGLVRVRRWPGETCPHLPLPATWDEMRRRLGKKLRSNLGYYERTLNKLYAVEMRPATPETLDSDMSAFFDLHQRRWNTRWLPGAFAPRRVQGFHRAAAAALFSRGSLRLHLMLLDGEPQAALYCFQFGGRCAYYAGGFEPSLARLSVGTVLTGHAIRYAITDDAADDFDFLRGDEAYKYRWGAQDRRNRRVSVTRPGLRPALVASAGWVSLRAELSAKAWMHRRHGGRRPPPSPPGGGPATAG
jgi:CelD/BcsL family acetyltransferase involved in cellulose biosynthesis